MNNDAYPMKKVGTVTLGYSRLLTIVLHTLGHFQCYGGFLFEAYHELLGQFIEKQTGLLILTCTVYLPLLGVRNN
jgi:hypothetical protein